MVGYKWYHFRFLNLSKFKCSFLNLSKFKCTSHPQFHPHNVRAVRIWQYSPRFIGHSYSFQFPQLQKILLTHNILGVFEETWAVWYKTKFGSQNFGYQICVIFVICIWCFKKYAQCKSNDNVIKYYDSMIWHMCIEKSRGLPTVVAFGVK